MNELKLGALMNELKQAFCLISSGYYKFNKPVKIFLKFKWIGFECEEDIQGTDLTSRM